MNRDLWPFYERELQFLRDQAKEFRAEYPQEAGRLGFDPGGLSSDPHVERMIQSFALLAARVRLKIDDDFPELTDALLTLLQPHALAPLPSMLIAQFTPKPGADLTNGYVIPRGQPFESTPFDVKDDKGTITLKGVRCDYRTVYTTTVWPIAIMETSLKNPPHLDLQDLGLPEPKSALKFTLELVSGKSFAELAIGKGDPERGRPHALRLHIAPESVLTPALYELLANQVSEVVFRLPGTRTIARVPAAKAIRPVGFDLTPEHAADDESVLPYPRSTFPGYRLLTEYFAYREKFWFIDLLGWDDALAAGALAGRTLEVQFLLTTKTPPERNKAVKADTFALGCVPMVNLFRKASTEPVVVSHRQAEYPLVVASHNPAAFEIYSVDRVFYQTGEAGEVEYAPFYSFRHKKPKDDGKVPRFWFAQRRPSRLARDFGTEIDVQFCDAQFSPTAPAEDLAFATVTCLNRDLPTFLRENIDDWQLLPQGDVPPATVTVLRKPSRTRRPMQKPAQDTDDSHRRLPYWRLISQLAINHLSLADGERGRQALTEYLALYDTGDARENDPHRTVDKIRDGLLRVASERSVEFVAGDEASGFVRGVDITIECDEPAFLEIGLFLFASVLERYFAAAVSMNSFTRMVLKSRQQKDRPIKIWPPRAGDRPLV
jgi:type VI secretion system protein ImpG